jgi:hypothetical protein
MIKIRGTAAVGKDMEGMAMVPKISQKPNPEQRRSLLGIGFCTAQAAPLPGLGSGTAFCFCAFFLPLRSEKAP